MRSLVPARIRTVGRERISHWLPALQQDWDRKRVHAHAQIHRIEGWLGVESLFDSVLVLERSPSDATDSQRPLRFVSETYTSPTRVALELNVTIHPDRVTLDLLYKAATAQKEAMETVLEHFEVLLEGLVKHPDRNPATLAMRTRSEGRDRFWKTLEKVGEAR
jgi:polyketide synthase PksN